MDKFYQKWYKHQEDTRAIIEGQMRKEKEKEAKWYGDVEGVEELMEKGNIKEAAVVFSREGMKVFTKLFINSVERSVEETLMKGITDLENKISELIEKSVEKKLVEVMEGITEGIKQFTNENMDNHIKISLPTIRDTTIPDDPLTGEKQNERLANLADSNLSDIIIDKIIVDKIGQEVDKKVTQQMVEEDITKTVEEIKSDTETSKVEKKPNKKADKPSYTEEGIRIITTKDAGEVLPLVINIMKANGGPMKLVDINNKLVELYNMKFTSSGCTSFMNKIIKLDYNIEKVGYGLYEYREKNFKPTL